MNVYGTLVPRIANTGSANAAFASVRCADRQLRSLTDCDVLSVARWPGP